MDEIKNNALSEPDDTDGSSPKDEAADALASFLSRDNTKDDEKKKKTSPLKWILIGAAAVAVLVGVLLLVNRIPAADEEEDIVPDAEIALSVDDNGEHQADVPAAENAPDEPAQNGAGTLLSYYPADISRIDVKNENGSFFLELSSVTVTDDDGDESEETVYTLNGSIPDDRLQPGVPDELATDASSLAFSSVVSLGKQLSDFGFDAPKATVNVTYTDGTTALVTVGGEAPGEAGTYITFGSSETVYLVTDDAVDSFFYTANDFISLTVTESADDTSSAFSKLTISGSRYEKPIVIEPNADEALSCSYLVTSPKKMFADETESADIAGAILGLYAEEVTAFDLSSAEAEKFTGSPYAKIEAVYPDATIVLYAQEPDDSGKTEIYYPKTNVVYAIDLGAVEWVNTSLEKLTPETVLGIKKTAVKNISVTIDDMVYSFDVETKTDTVENDDGETEEVTTTTARFGDKTLSDENFSIFFQNLTAMKNVKKADETVSGSGDAMLTVTVSYTTGRKPDTFTALRTDGTKCPILLNGDSVGLVYKNYITKFIACTEALAAGETVTSF